MLRMRPGIRQPSLGFQNPSGFFQKKVLKYYYNQHEDLSLSAKERETGPKILSGADVIARAG